LKDRHPSEAARSLEQALRVKPDDAPARNALAVALVDLKDRAGARTQLERARALDPNNPLYQDNLRCLERDLEGCELAP
jgi:Flp pilus assembly protein TadD